MLMRQESLDLGRALVHIALMLIYKILRADEWAQLQRDRVSKGAPVDIEDGFVHFSSADQLRETAARHFAGEDDLWLLAIEADGLAGLTWEPSRGGALFPHLYAPLTMEMIRSAQELPLGADGHQFPEEIR